MNEKLLSQSKLHLQKALRHLSISLGKVEKLSSDASAIQEEDLETWESFSSRFSRASDIFISKILRSWILKRDPAFRGSLLDTFNEAEKAGLIDDAKIWMRIRELRNVAAHEYAEDDLSALFDEIRKLAPTILKVGENLD